MESPFRVRAFVRAARDLFVGFFTSGGFGASLTELDAALGKWMDDSQIGKEAAQQLHKAMVKLVKNPIIMRVAGVEGGIVNMLCYNL
jgi:hypothetical protein